MNLKHRIAALAIVVGLGGAAHAATSALPDDAIVVAPGRWPVPVETTRADAARVLQRLQAHGGEAAYAQLATLADPLRFEAAAAAVIHRLQAAPDGLDAGLLLERLAATPVRVFHRHEETRGDWFLPLFDVPAKARSVQRALAFARARAALAQRAEQDPLLLQQADPALAAAVVMQGSDRLVAHLAGAAGKKSLRLPSPAWAALARRSPQAAVLERLLAEARPVDVLPVLQEADATIAADTALAFAEKSLAHGEYASTGVALLGRLAARSPAASKRLLTLLADPALGDSAAAALAQGPREERLARIDEAFAEAHDPDVRRRLALALRLEGSPAAQARLRRLAEDPGLATEAAKELQR